ncbi:MAG: hypothetical protein ACFFCW_31735, partial [Candidatus Hodarchaeota archaeon]
GLYADDNDDKIVSGAGGVDRPYNGKPELPWVGRCWHNNYQSGAQLPEDEQKGEIKDGALWPYCKDIKLYRCPTGARGEMLTYAVMDSMNGYGDEMCIFCINRNDAAINVLFMDWTSRKVGLKELWTLKWHCKFDIAGPYTGAGGFLTEDWPEWMRSFKDY